MFEKGYSVGEKMLIKTKKKNQDEKHTVYMHLHIIVHYFSNFELYYVQFNLDIKFVNGFTSCFLFLKKIH